MGWTLIFTFESMPGNPHLTFPKGSSRKVLGSIETSFFWKIYVSVCEQFPRERPLLWENWCKVGVVWNFWPTIGWTRFSIHRGLWRPLSNSCSWILDFTSWGWITLQFMPICSLSSFRGFTSWNLRQQPQVEDGKEEWVRLSSAGWWLVSIHVQITWSFPWFAPHSCRTRSNSQFFNSSAICRSPPPCPPPLKLGLRSLEPTAEAATPATPHSQC